MDLLCSSGMSHDRHLHVPVMEILFKCYFSSTKIKVTVFIKVCCILIIMKDPDALYFYLKIPVIK